MPLHATLIKSALSRQGGIEKYTWKIAEELCNRGLQVTLLTTENPTPPFTHPSLKLISFPIQHSLSVLNVLHFDRACTRYLKAHPTPVIFTLDRHRVQTHHRAGNGVHAAYLEQRAKEEGFWKQLSFSLNPLHRTLLHLEKQTFESPQLRTLFVNSQMVKQQVLHHYRTDPRKIEVVYNGVEWEEMEDPFVHWEEGKKKFTSLLGLDPDAFQFLFLGHNFRRKGLEKLMRALSLLPQEKFQLSVIGKEKELPRFQALAKQLDLSSKIFFFGPQNQTLPFYQLADALVIPSLYDPFANVTLEGLSMGLITLSSIHNGGKEILTAENGKIIPNLDNPEEFADLLKQTLRHRKTPSSAAAIRASVRYLNFSSQLQKISDHILANH